MQPILSKDSAKNRFSEEKENKLSFLSVRFLFKTKKKPNKSPKTFILFVEMHPESSGTGSLQNCPCALPVVRLTTEEFPETVSLPCTVAPDNTIRSNTVVTNYNFIWVTCKSVWIA